MKEPKARPITIEIFPSSERSIDIEALTPEAKAWVEANARKYGSLIHAHDHSFFLLVHRGYNLREVCDYLNELWDSQQWPEEVEEKAAEERPVHS